MAERDGEKGGGLEGVVIRVDAQYPMVECGERHFRCAVRKKLKYKLKGAVKRVCVGDRVVVTEPPSEGDIGAIEAVLPRNTLLARNAPGREGYRQAVAANVDQLMIVASTHNPEINPRFIDRMLVGGERGELDCIIVVNKIDLADREKILDALQFYPKIGYRLIFTSAKEGEGLEDLREVLTGKSTVFAGPSGAGKSSLLNAIQPGMKLTIGEVSGRTGKGRHTTTFVQLLKLDFGGYVVDTPGIREFGLWDVEKRDLVVYFREMAHLVDGCKFKDCRHINEPGCAIKAAVEAGDIARARYESYVLIFNTMEEKEQWQ